MVRSMRHASYLIALLALLALGLLMVSGDATATADSNNDHTQAVEVENSDVLLGSVSTTDDLEDYFKIYVESGDVLDFYLVMDSGTDLDLYLFDGSLVLVDQSSTDNNASGVFTEQVTINVATTGWHYLSVYAYSGESDYYLWVRSTAEWTIMVYMDGDNNLEGQAIADFLEISDVGSSPDVNIVVQMDRFDGFVWNGAEWEYVPEIDDISNGDWTGAMRFRVEQGVTPESAYAWDDLGEVDMGSDETLSDFIIWSLGYFPAHHNMLVLWDHGGGWQGVCYDDFTYPNTMLTPQDLRFAMETVDSAYPSFTFDVIGFDACIMSGLETYYELASYTSYFVGSQINEPGMGWNYERSLARLVTAPTLSAEALSCYIAGDYVDSYTLPIAPYPVQEVTASVIDASELADVALDLNTLADEMTVQMSARHNYYQYCREMCQYYYGDYVDLMDWAWWVSDYAPSSLVRQYASDLYYSASDAVVFSSYNDAEGGMDITWTLGLNLYYPEASGDYDPNYGSALLLTLGTLYDNMLVDYYQKTALANDPIEIDYGLPAAGPNVTSGGSIEFYVSASDSDPDLVFWFWYVDGVFQPSNTTLSMVLATNDSMIGEHTVVVWVWDGLSWDSYSWDLTVLAKPDLMIFDFYLLDADLEPIEEITSGRPSYVLVQMMNQGGSDANNFTVTCYIDFVYFCHWDYSVVASGTDRSLLSWSFPLSELGMHVVTFVLDPYGAVDESNESNNQYSWAVDVVPAKWTLLIYMDGDNNLEPYMVDNFLQMASVGSDANVSVVVQFDRIGGYDTRYEDWTDCLRFYVEYGMTPTPANATADLGEVNMADRSTLESFLAWGTQTYQAERYIVVLKDHGSSWLGCCQDVTSGGDLLDLKETSFALRSMLNITGAPIDLLVFDDCLMGSVEVATEFKDLALYAVVSETVGWTSNHDYSAILSFLEGDPEMSSRSAALGLTDLMHLVDDETHITQCVATYDLQRMDTLLAALEAYLLDLAPYWGSDEGGMEMARLYSESLDIYYGNDGLDLYQFVLNTMFFYDEEGLNASGQEVLRMLDPASPGSVVLSKRATPVASFCHGMSAYFPRSAAVYNPSYGSSGAFSDISVWDSMVYTYLTYSAPLSLLFLDGTMGDDDWYVSQVNATFLVYDPSSLGQGYLNYSYGGIWFPYSGETLVMSEDGDHSLYYYATGLNGEVEVVRNANLRIDKTAPSVTAEVNGRTFALSGSDATSGLRSIHYRIDGGSWILYTGEVTVGTVGHQYLVEYYAIDNAGNVCSVDEMTVGEEDTQAPYTSLELLGAAGTNGWFIGDVQAILSADDGDGVGVSSISFRIDVGDWHTYDGQLWFNETGTYVLSYRSEDASGNLDAVRTAEVKVDKIAPTAMIDVRDPDFGLWYNNSVPVTFGGNDEGSGLFTVQYRLNGGSWSSADEFTYAAEAISLLEWRAVDNAGNYGEIANMTLRLDTQGSIVFINVGGFDEDGWTNESVPMDFMVFKQGPANTTVCIRVNGGDWVAVGDRVYFNESGEYHVDAMTVDEANNTGSPTSSVHFYIDRALPASVLNVTGLSDSPNVYLNSVMIDIEGTDEGKGLDRCMYRIDDGTWREITAPFSLTQAGEYTLEYYSVDLVGNREETHVLNLTVKVAYVPGQVIGLTAEADDDGIALTWSAPSDGGTAILSYKVYRSVNGGEVVEIAEIEGTSFIDDEVDEGNNYTYYVKALNLLGDGPSSLGSEMELQSEGSSGTGLVIVLVVIIVIVVAVVALVLIRKKK